MSSRTQGILPLAILLAVPVLAGAAERAVSFDAAASTVTFTLDTTFHEVHGTMAMTGGTIRFDPGTGAASGEISVDARRAETGNGSRDKKMHGEILETEKFPSIVFRVEKVEGALVEPGSSDLRLVGVLSLHGADHPMILPAKVEISNGQVTGDVEFTVPYVEWGLEDPSFFIARAAKTVDVRIHAVGHWTDGIAHGK